jgi:hypothetical protein
VTFFVSASASGTSHSLHVINQQEINTMSAAQLEKFAEVLSQEPAILQNATKGTEQLDELLLNLVRAGKARGYEFTVDEARAWAAQYAAPVNGELSEATLDAVAGGTTNPLSTLGGVLKGYVQRHRL